MAWSFAIRSSSSETLLRTTSRNSVKRKLQNLVEILRRRSGIDIENTDVGKSTSRRAD